MACWTQPPYESPDEWFDVTWAKYSARLLYWSWPQGLTYSSTTVGPDFPLMYGRGESDNNLYLAVIFRLSPRRNTGGFLHQFETHCPETWCKWKLIEPCFCWCHQPSTLHHSVPQYEGDGQFPNRIFVVPPTVPAYFCRWACIVRVPATSRQRNKYDTSI